MFEEIVGSSVKQYCASFPNGTTIFFRLLTLLEYERTVALKAHTELSDIQFYEKIYNYCVTSPYKDLGGEVRAGIPSAIGEFILWASMNVDTVENEIESARNKYASSESMQYYEDMKRVILMAFSGYTPDDLDNKNRFELTDLFVRAEGMLQLKSKGEYTPINTKTLRQQQKTNTIDFAKENKEIQKAGLNREDSPWGRNGQAHELQQIREKASRRAATAKKG